MVEPKSPERSELRQLWEHLERREAQAGALGEVISIISCNADPDDVLKTIVGAAPRSLHAHACFIFLWEEESEQLVLRRTSAPYAHLTGAIRLQMGEGLAGWAALTKRPIIMTHKAPEDPRFKPFDELDEEEYQSEILMPIISRQASTLGVIALNFVAPRQFTPDEVDFLNNVAMLIAGMLENVQTHGRSQRELESLSDLFDFVQSVSSAPDVETIAQTAAEAAARLLRSDLCAVLLRDATHEYLEVRAAFPMLPGNMEAKPILSSRAIDWQNLAGAQEAGLVFPRSMSLSTTSAWETKYQTALSVPMVSGNDFLGMLNCYTLKERRYSPRELGLLKTVANHAAAAIRKVDLISLLMERTTASGFLHCLITGAYESPQTMALRGMRLGCDLSKVHCVAIAELVDRVEGADDSDFGNDHSCSQAVRLFESMVRSRRPGSVFSSEGDLVVCIAAAESDQDVESLKSSITAAQESIMRSHSVSVSVGIGNCCRRIEDYQRGYTEAREALQIGRTIFGPGRVVHYLDLGLYRYLWEMSTMSPARDAYQAKVSALEDYDARKGTQLLSTLETLLECLGNANKASRRLFIHRNTLYQRLEKIRDVAGIDLTDENPDNWLAYEIALKLVRLRQRLVGAAGPPMDMDIIHAGGQDG